MDYAYFISGMNAGLLIAILLKALLNTKRIQIWWHRCRAAHWEASAQECFSYGWPRQFEQTWRDWHLAQIARLEGGK